MPKKKTPKSFANPITSKTAVSEETLRKAYRLVKRSGIATGKQPAPVVSLDDIVAFSQTPEARARTIAGIRNYGGYLYATDLKHPGLIVQVSPNGTRRLGRLVKRKFVEYITRRRSIAEITPR